MDHFDAASVAELDRREGEGPVEGVAAVWVRVAVALKAFQIVAGWKRKEKSQVK